MNTGTTIYKIHKTEHLSQFVKDIFQKYPIFTNKTTALLLPLQSMVEETNLYKNDYHSYMTGVAVGQNFKIYSHQLMQFVHYENMPIQIHWKFYHQKMKILR